MNSNVYNIKRTAYYIHCWTEKYTANHEHYCAECSCTLLVLLWFLFVSNTLKHENKKFKL